MVLGASGSGRRQIVSDLIDGGLEATDTPRVLISSEEAPDPADATLPGLGRFTPLPMCGIDGEFPRDASHVFILFDGRKDPVDQIEGFKTFLSDRGQEVGIVITVVNCQLAEKSPKLIAWYEACVHFSDIVLLANRDGVANKWITDFKARFTGRFFPCLFEFVKDGKVKNPALILSPVVRRMSHVFDEDEWVPVDDDEDEEDAEDGDEVEVKQAVDPYLERRSSGGRYLALPDVNEFLPPRGS